MQQTHSSICRPIFHGWFLFLCGFCMGIADLIPGISGGTIAFILGFYYPLLESLKTINVTNLKELFRGNFYLFFQKVAWRFLLTVGAGIICAIASLATFFHFVLNHEIYRIYLYSLFFGLIIASFVFCLRQVHCWCKSTVISLILGVLLAYLLAQWGDTQTITALKKNGLDGVASNHFLNGWLMICGTLAAFALLLPGISGSYLLTILGVYPTIIKGLVDFIQGLKQFIFVTEAFSILASMAIGVVLGLLGFARFLSWLLRCYPNQTLALLSGVMIGAIRSVWPFWLFKAQGTQLIAVEPYFPAIHSLLLWQAVGCSLLGFTLVMALEYMAKQKTKVWN